MQLSSVEGSVSFLRAEVNMTIVLVLSTRQSVCCAVLRGAHSCSVLWCGVVFASGGLVFMTSFVQQWSTVLGIRGICILLSAAAAMASVSVASVMESIYQSTSMGRLEMRWWVAKIVDRKNAY